MDSDYDLIMDAIAGDDLEALVSYAEMLDDFPTGKHRYARCHWVTDAIDCGTPRIVDWMIKEGAPLIFVDDEGYSVLHSAIEREHKDKYGIMRALLDNGADIDAKGINGWTPGHMAAVRNDLDALILLDEYGADFSIKTEIDSYETPYEGAIRCGADAEIINWLKNHA